MGCARYEPNRHASRAVPEANARSLWKAAISTKAQGLRWRLRPPERTCIYVWNAASAAQGIRCIIRYSTSAWEREIKCSLRTFTYILFIAGNFMARRTLSKPLSNADLRRTASSTHSRSARPGPQSLTTNKESLVNRLQGRCANRVPGTKNWSALVRILVACMSVAVDHGDATMLL